MDHAGEMNRKQRRKQSRSKSNTRRTGVTYLAIAGLAGGSIGLVTPVQATETLCNNLKTELEAAATSGGNIIADFSATCDFAEGFVFGGATTITGPADRSLTLRFADSATRGFTTVGDLNLSNLIFARSSNLPNLDYFIYSNNSSPITVSNTTFSNAKVDAAIYSEGHIEVSDSSFTNLNLDYHAIDARGTSNVSNSSFKDLSTINSGAAIAAYGELTVTDSTFATNSSLAHGGALISFGALSVTGSTFESNEVRDISSGGGAVFGNSGITIQDSTFKNNRSPGYGGAIYSNGSLSIANSGFDSNESLDGGGGAIYGPDVSVLSSTFSNNLADDGYGGALMAGAVDIDNSTFANNSAEDAGAMYSEGGGIVSNSTFWLNSVDDPSSTSIDTSGSINFFANILADEKPYTAAEGNDLGANLVTDPTFTPSTAGEGASQQVAVSALKLSALALNQTSPVNTGTTKTVAIAADSVARDYYSATSAGINPTGNSTFATRIAALDQRGVARQPSVNRLDVGAYDDGQGPDPSPSATPDPSPSATPDPSPSATLEITDVEALADTAGTETLADTGLNNQTSFLALIGIGLAAILGGSAGLIRRRRKV
jgi:LPXTG-motif cell wall-anchored protein